MELTKFEKMVMDPHYLKKCKWSCLYLGLAFIAIGTGLVVYGYMNPIPKTTALWEKNLTMLKKIVPSTANEKDLLRIATSFADAAKRGWTGYVEDKIISTCGVFLIAGGFLVGLYIRERRYSKLIEKIRDPNQ